MSTVYTVTATETAPFGMGVSYWVRAESTTPGCSHWYRAFVPPRGGLLVMCLDDEDGTRELRDLDGNLFVLSHDCPIRRQVAGAVERYTDGRGRGGLTCR